MEWKEGRDGKGEKATKERERGRNWMRQRKYGMEER